MWHELHGRIFGKDSVAGWREALNELDTAYPSRLR
jgi:hypothetical protein